MDSLLLSTMATLTATMGKGFNPYSNGFSSFIRSTEKILYFQPL